MLTVGFTKMTSYSLLSIFTPRAQHTPTQANCCQLSEQSVFVCPQENCLPTARCWKPPLWWDLTSNCRVCVSPGKLFANCKVLKTPSLVRSNQELSRRLWNASAELCGLEVDAEPEEKPVEDLPADVTEEDKKELWLVNKRSSHQSCGFHNSLKLLFFIFRPTTKQTMSSLKSCFSHFY